MPSSTTSNRIPVGRATTFLTSADHCFAEAVTPDPEIWETVRVRSADRRFTAGYGPLLDLTIRPRTRHVKGRGCCGPAARPQHRYRQNDPLTDIEAEVYLEFLDPDTEPGRGRCRCPLPDHEDRNPSASYSGTAWFCHRCGVGGGVYQAAAAVSGLPDRGPGFRLLREWTADQLGVKA